MFQRIITNFAKNNFTTKENITITNTNTDFKLRLQCGIGFFVVGGCVEAFTFS